MLDKISPIAKTVAVFVIAVLVGAVAQGLINGASALWVNVIIGALAAAGVYRIPNGQP